MPSVKSLTVLIAIVAVYCNWPQPPLSHRLQKWKGSGKYFKFNDFNIFYKDSLGQGVDNDLVVLILHGFPSSTYDWYKMWDGLTARFGRVIAPDFIGFGLSDKPRGHSYTMVEQADIMESLLAELGVKRVHILAHDMGDTVAQELIARQNDVKKSNKKPAELDILSVCLTNGGILPETLELRFGQKVMLNPWIAPIGLRITNRMIFRRAFGEVFGEQTQPTPEEFEDQWALIQWNDGNLIGYDLIQYLPQRFANRDKWVGALQETKIPLHLIFGPSDPINPPDTFLKRYKMLIPQSGVTQLADHISHYPQLEDPDNVLKAYIKFTDSLKIQ